MCFIAFSSLKSGKEEKKKLKILLRLQHYISFLKAKDMYWFNWPLIKYVT